MKTILVVDDEPNYLIVLSEILRDEGFEVFTAEGGKKGAYHCPISRPRSCCFRYENAWYGWHSIP